MTPSQCWGREYRRVEGGKEWGGLMFLFLKIILHCYGTLITALGSISKCNYIWRWRCLHLNFRETEYDQYIRMLYNFVYGRTTTKGSFVSTFFVSECSRVSLRKLDCPGRQLHVRVVQTHSLHCWSLPSLLVFSKVIVSPVTLRSPSPILRTATFSLLLIALRL